MKNDWKLSRCGKYEIYYTDFLNSSHESSSVKKSIEDIENINSLTTKSGKRIRIVSVDSRERNRVIGIILAKENDIVGASEVHVLEDGNAEISTLTFLKEQIELPENLKSQSHKFERNEGIFVDDTYRWQGYGSDILKIILTYLKTIHVDKLEIHGITQHGAVDFYRKTGAKILNQTTAEYDVPKALDFLKNHRTMKKNTDIEFE